TIGAIIRQGPHHGAHRSSSTGSGEASTSPVKLASVTVTGAVSNGKGCLQRPHTGRLPGRTAAASTRLVAPHEGQRTRVVSAVEATARLHAALAQVLARLVEHLLDLRLGPAQLAGQLHAR